MLNVKIGNGNEEEESVEIGGSPLDILSEAGAVIGAIYRYLSKASKPLGTLFRAYLKRVVEDDDCPAWKVEDDETEA